MSFHFKSNQAKILDIVNIAVLGKRCLTPMPFLYLFVC